MCLHIELPWALATPAGTLRCNSKVGYASKDTVKGRAAQQVEKGQQDTQ